MKFVRNYILFVAVFPSFFVFGARNEQVEIIPVVMSFDVDTTIRALSGDGRVSAGAVFYHMEYEVPALGKDFLNDCPYFGSVNALSYDGSLAAGYVIDKEHRRYALRWSRKDGRYAAEYLNSLKDDVLNVSEVFALSYDGNIAAGKTGNSTGEIRAVRWLWENGSHSIEDLKTLKENSRGESVARALSRDGQIVAGQAENDEGEKRAVRWMVGNGKSAIDDLKTLKTDKTGHSIAYGLSHDGGIVVGEAENDARERRAVRWAGNGANLEIQDLGTLKGHSSRDSSAYAVSGDGNVVVGTVGKDDATRAFVWTKQGGMEALNSLGAGGQGFTRANAVSADGNVVGGTSIGHDMSHRATLWKGNWGSLPLVETPKPEVKPEPQPEPKPPVVAPQSPVVTPEPPVVAPQPPVVTPEPPVVAPQPPVVIPEPPVVAPQPPVVTPEPPVVAPQPPVVTPEPPVVAPQPPVVTPEPPVVAPQLPVVTPELPVVAPQPPVVTPEPPVEAPQPPVVTPEPPVVAPQPPVVTPEPPVEAPQPPVVTPEPPVVAPQPPVVTPEPPVVAPQPPVVTPEPPVVAPQPPVVAPEPPAETPQSPNQVIRIVKTDIANARKARYKLASDTFQAMEMQRNALKSLVEGCDTRTQGEVCVAGGTGYRSSDGSSETVNSIRLGVGVTDNLSAGISVARSLVRELPDSFTKNNDNLGVGAWVNWRFPDESGEWYLRLAGAQNRYETKIATVDYGNADSGKGTPDIDGWTLSVEGGRQFRFASGTTLTAHAGVVRDSLKREGYTDSGNSFAYDYAELEYETDYARVGAALNVPVTSKLAWITAATVEQDLSNDAPVFSGKQTYVGDVQEKMDLTHTRWNVGSGLAYEFTPGIEVRAMPWIGTQALGDTQYGANLTLFGRF